MKLFNEISNRNELAEFLNIPIQLLTYTLYATNTDDLYTNFKISKKSGGFRTINAPIDPLKTIQEKLSEEITNYIHFISERLSIKTNISHGFIQGKSIITNAEIHRNKHSVLNIDLKDFFPSIHFGRVKGFFEKNRYFNFSSEVATVIAQITCYKSRLPQGAPTSPVISNLISNILDFRILKIAKKYQLDYTRYADDLTFSTNNQNFINKKKNFLSEIETLIEKSGFKINHNKIRLQHRDSRQEVTGLTVNKKINSKKEFRKNTRAMAHNLYTTGSFHLEDGEPGTIEQLEGRFSFINQIDWYNNRNKKIANNKPYYKDLTSREKEYQKSLYYKIFISNEKPLLVTEGKTDVKYLKAAIKGLSTYYPDLFELDDSNQSSYKVSFLNRFDNRRNHNQSNKNFKPNKLKYFFNIEEYGADTMKNIFNLYIGEHGLPNLWELFTKKYHISPTNPVILIFDNEQKNNSPLKKFKKHLKKKKQYIEPDKIFKNIDENLHTHIIGNLHVLTLPQKNNTDTEIENLFTENDLKVYEKSNKVNLNSGNKDSHLNYSLQIN